MEEGEVLGRAPEGDTKAVSFLTLSPTTVNCAATGPQEQGPQLRTYTMCQEHFLTFKLITSAVWLRQRRAG